MTFVLTVALTFQKIRYAFEIKTFLEDFVIFIRQIFFFFFVISKNIFLIKQMKCSLILEKIKILCNVFFTLSTGVPYLRIAFNCIG